MISTRDLSRLPDINSLKRLWQSMAMLDAILCPEWEYRYYSFNAHWHAGKHLGSMRNGCGDEMFALFSKDGCCLKGFAHEAKMSPYRVEPPEIWPGILDDVPREFASCLAEPAFNIADTTFCIWRRDGDETWSRGTLKYPAGGDPDGSAFLFNHLLLTPADYQECAESYLEQSVALISVRSTYEHCPLTAQLVSSLNPELTLEALEQEIEEIGYPA